MSAFAAFAVADSSSSSESEEEAPKVELKKPKKKQNKKKKGGAKDSDEEFLNSVIKEQTPAFKGKMPIEIGESVLLMDRLHFNYRKELRTLYS